MTLAQEDFSRVVGSEAGYKRRKSAHEPIHVDLHAQSWIHGSLAEADIEEHSI